ncbi:hypothetical protein BaRGS_00012671 [Batillaria attramentaria]|uniref:Uncharacterized protein n=1 Tax=Batillaria attramentaria TaxID=370345 RepID=A0ABD0L9V1_9CAEN
MQTVKRNWKCFVHLSAIHRKSQWRQMDYPNPLQISGLDGARPKISTVEIHWVCVARYLKQWLTLSLHGNEIPSTEDSTRSHKTTTQRLQTPKAVHYTNPLCLLQYTTVAKAVCRNEPQGRCEERASSLKVVNNNRVLHANHLVGRRVFWFTNSKEEVNTTKRT